MFFFEQPTAVIAAATAGTEVKTTAAKAAAVARDEVDAQLVG